MVNEATVVSTINPSTEELLAQYEIMDKAKVAHIVKQAIGAFADWKSIDNQKRAEFIHNFAQELRKNKTKLAQTATKEMGKPI